MWGESSFPQALALKILDRSLKIAGEGGVTRGSGIRARAPLLILVRGNPGTGCGVRAIMCSARWADKRCNEDLLTKHAQQVSAWLPTATDPCVQCCAYVVLGLCRNTYKSFKFNKTYQSARRPAIPIFLSSVRARSPISRVFDFVLVPFCIFSRDYARGT